MPYTSGNNAKIALSINVIMITALLIFLKTPNLILQNESFKKLNYPSLNCIISSVNIISPINNSLILHHSLITTSQISETLSTRSHLSLLSMSLSPYLQEKLLTCSAKSLKLISLTNPLLTIVKWLPIIVTSLTSITKVL